MIVALLGLVAALLVIKAAQRLGRLSTHPDRPPLPPGPKPLPFIGNALDVDKDVPHLTYTALSKTHGDIVHMRVFGQDIVILNSERVAIAFLEKRSQKYSNRPPFAAQDLFGWGWTTACAQYGPRLRLHRRLLRESFHAKAALGYRDRQLQRAYELSTCLLNDPTDYATHIAMFSVSVVMEVTYGYDMKGGESFVTSMQRAADIILRVTTPERVALCAALPFVVSLPSWIPGMGWMSEADESRRLVYDGLNTPYAWVKRRMEEGNAKPSMVANAITRYRLDNDSSNPELLQAIKESAATLYAASVETTRATLLVFVYLLMNNPEVQRRAQAEIDRVVGEQRLPDFGDRVSLPYVDAVLRETMRLHPVLPISIPRATIEDDVCEGYYIPQGAIVLPNVWAMSHNEEKYPNPDAFIPERFLREDGLLNEDNVPWIFGFGRRMCPGRYIADASLWCAMVCMLSLFCVERTEGSDNVTWTTGLSRHPHPFPCRLVPRNEEMDPAKLASLIYASRSGLDDL